MKGFVTVDTPEDFEKWLAEQAAAAGGGAAAPAEAPRSPNGEAEDS